MTHSVFSIPFIFLLLGRRQDSSFSLLQFWASHWIVLNAGAFSCLDDSSAGKKKQWGWWFKPILQSYFKWTSNVFLLTLQSVYSCTRFIYSIRPAGSLSQHWFRFHVESHCVSIWFSPYIFVASQISHTAWVQCLFSMPWILLSLQQFSMETGAGRNHWPFTDLSAFSPHC